VNPARSEKPEANSARPPIMKNEFYDIFSLKKFIENNNSQYTVIN